MTRQAQRTPAQVNKDQFDANAKKAFYNARHSAVHKKATVEAHANLTGRNRGKKGYGLRAVVEKYNKEELTSPNDKKLNYQTVHDAIKRGEIGVSPPKKGRPKTVPDELTQGLATHATMMQATGEGEA